MFFQRVSKTPLHLVLDNYMKSCLRQEALNNYFSLLKLKVYSIYTGLFFRPVDVNQIHVVM